MTHKPPQGIDALFKLSRKVAAEYTKHAGSDDLCELEGEECLADFLYRALSDTQGIDAPNCAHKQLKKQMVGEQCWYACECGQKFRVEPWDGKVSVLAPPDPRKDLAAPVEERRIYQWPAVKYERREKPWMYPLEGLVVKWREANSPEPDGKFGAGQLQCADELEQRLAEMRGAKR